MRLRPALSVIYKVIQRTLDDGFSHAGNLAYLSLTSLFPMFVVIASIAGALGRTETGLEALRAFMAQVPPDVAEALGRPIAQLLERGGGKGLLTIGIIIGLWSVTGYVDTVRDIIRRAYGTPGGSLWRSKLMSTLGVIVAVVLLMIGFTAQFILVGIEQFIVRLAPIFSEVLSTLRATRLLQVFLIFLPLYAVFALLTPVNYAGRTRFWPGALLTTGVWMGATSLLPAIIAQFANYELTYGSLAGVMISLLFFYVVGVGLVAGAHLNAVLAGATPLNEREGIG